LRIFEIMETTANILNDDESRNEKPINQDRLSPNNTSIGQSAPSRNQDALDAQRGDNDNFMTSGLDEAHHGE
jgi:hypothetical protein